MRLINADRLKAVIQQHVKDHPGYPVYEQIMGLVCGLLDDSPTVDAVEVVRCKDCTEWGGVPFGNVCRRWSAPLAGMKNCTGPDDYCSYGKRGDRA